VELFNDFFEPFAGWEFISRTGHVLAGITWIGLLYFFNVVQVPGLRRALGQLAVRGAAQAHLPGPVVVPVRGAADLPVRHLDPGHARLGRRWLVR
jgi:hypothetical protein